MPADPKKFTPSPETVAWVRKKAKLEREAAQRLKRQVYGKKGGRRG